MKLKLQLFMLVTTVLLLVACGKKSIVVLVPEPTGSVGRITVSNSAGFVEISKPNQATEIINENTAPSAPAEIKGEKINALFSEALAILPPNPIHFILFIEKDSTRVSPESLNQISEIIVIIKERASDHISVIGHTDTLGDEDYNQNLSFKRATAVKNLLIQQGIREDLIETTSHGKKNLLIKTQDNVAEVKNRRVEVVVR